MLSIEARAKINLTLDILGKRSDGYHEVEMVMQAIALSDTLKFRETPVGAGVQLACDLPGLPGAERNLAYRAAKLVLERFHIRQGVAIELKKRIPIAAGLAGGSTDAAAAIIALNDLFKLGLDADALCALGAEIGSDVAFCVRGGTMLAKGRGELLSPLPAMRQCWAILAKPQVRVSTAWAYQNYRPENVKQRPNTARIITYLENGDFEGIGKSLCNVLESVTIHRHPEIAALKRQMREHGASASLMSGSGPTVFGLTPDEERARYIAARLSDLEKVRVILTKTVQSD